LWVAGCASSGAIREAQRGDYVALSQQLATALKNNHLDGTQVREIASVVAQREVRGARGNDAVTRINEARFCANHVQDALRDRAQTRDEAGARAAYVLVDQLLDAPSTWAPQARQNEPSWRAAGARALFESASGPLRRNLFLDVTVDVRRAALQAAVDAHDAADAPSLLEVVRLDPDGLARSIAARALGRIGGEENVLRLYDRWQNADEPLRTAIVTAWHAKGSENVGGREKLRWVVATEHGTPGMVASLALSQQGEPDHSQGVAGLRRAILEETTPNRMMAIALASLDEPVLKQAVGVSSEGNDLDVRVAALRKLTQDSKLRAKALLELGHQATAGASVSRAARSAMAAAGDRRVVSLLAADTHDVQPDVRAWAAAELAAMGELAHAAQPLADRNASVRTRTACAILTSPRR